MLPPEYWLISIHAVSAFSNELSYLSNQSSRLRFDLELDETTMRPRHCNKTNIQLGWNQDRQLLEMGNPEVPLPDK
jgi:hypothetical protein